MTGCTRHHTHIRCYLSCLSSSGCPNYVPVLIPSGFKSSSACQLVSTFLASSYDSGHTVLVEIGTCLDLWTTSGLSLVDNFWYFSYQDMSRYLSVLALFVSRSISSLCYGAGVPANVASYQVLCSVPSKSCRLHIFLLSCISGKSSGSSAFSFSISRFSFYRTIGLAHISFIAFFPRGSSGWFVGSDTSSSFSPSLL